MKYVEAATLDDLPSGSLKSVEVEGKAVLLANIAGQIYAIGGKCTHAGGDLSKGRLEGQVVICPRHGSKFDVTTGNRIAGPAKNNQPVYSVKLDGKKITLGF
jgi:3-phenylpropionate/trans-cinnamate dioxygenase ferredoxin component